MILVISKFDLCSFSEVVRNCIEHGKRHHVYYIASDQGGSRALKDSLYPTFSDELEVSFLDGKWSLMALLFRLYNVKGHWDHPAHDSCTSTAVDFPKCLHFSFIFIWGVRLLYLVVSNWFEPWIGWKVDGIARNFSQSCCQETFVESSEALGAKNSFNFLSNIQMTLLCHLRSTFEKI